MTDQQDKDLLTLYRRSRQEEPSQLADTRIRQAAGKAVSIKPVETSVKKNRGWLLGLSTAAVLVLSFSVVLQVWMDQDEPSVILQESASVPVERPKPDFKPKLKPEPSLDVSEYDMNDSSFDDISAIPAPAAPLSKQAIGKQQSMPEEKLAEVAADREVFRKKAQTRVPGVDRSKRDSRSPDTLVIPQFPESVTSLQAMAPRLVVEQNDSGLIAVYRTNKLILTIQQQPKGASFKAWPGSEILGVKVDWQLSPQQLQGCEDGPVYLKCPLKQNVDAYFEGERLDFIRWIQD